MNRLELLSWAQDLPTHSSVSSLLIDVQNTGSTLLFKPPQLGVGEVRSIFEAAEVVMKNLIESLSQPQEISRTSVLSGALKLSLLAQAAEKRDDLVFVEKELLIGAPESRLQREIFNTLSSEQIEHIQNVIKTFVEEQQNDLSISTLHQFSYFNKVVFPIPKFLDFETLKQWQKQSDLEQTLASETSKLATDESHSVELIDLQKLIKDKGLSEEAEKLGLNVKQNGIK